MRNVGAFNNERRVFHLPFNCILELHWVHQSMRLKFEIFLQFFKPKLWPDNITLFFTTGSNTDPEFHLGCPKWLIEQILPFGWVKCN